MGEEVGTCNVRVQGEQIKKFEKEKEKNEKERNKKIYV
jgi:hypothetical protein